MAAFNGSDGSVSIQLVATEILLHISAWTMDWSRESHDITEFATTAGWKAKTVGLTKIVGTLEGFYQDAGEDALVAANVVGDAMDLILTAKAGKTFTFTDGAHLTNLSFQTETGTPNRWTASFTANIAPAIA